MRHAIGHRAQLSLTVAGAVLAASLGALTSFSAEAAVALVTFAALALLMARSYTAIAIFAAGVAPAMGGLSRGVGVPGLKPAEALLIVCLVVLTWKLFTSHGGFERSPVTLPMPLVLFAFVAIVMGIYGTLGPTPGTDAFIRVALQPAFLLVTFLVTAYSVAAGADLAKTSAAVVLASASVSAVAIIQFVGPPSFKSLVSGLTSDGTIDVSTLLQTERVTGPFPIWHSLIGYLIIPTVYTFCSVIMPRYSALPRWVMLVALMLQLSAFALSLTVTGLIWVVVSIAIAARLLGKLKWAALVGFLFVTMGVLVFGSELGARLEQQATPGAGTGAGPLPQTLQYRLLIWQQVYVPILRSYWLLGVGNYLPDGLRFAFTENQYLTWILRGGIALLLAAIIAMAWVLSQSLSCSRILAGAQGLDASRQWQDLRVLCCSLVGVVVFLFLSLTVWNYLSNSGLPQILFAVLGLLSSGVKTSNRSESTTIVSSHAKLASNAA